jgi:transposase
MSKKTRRRLDARLKAKVALEALGNEATIAELAAKYQLHPNLIHAWKKQLLDGAAAVFSSGAGKEASREAKVNELYAKIGQLTVERDFLSRRPRR